MEVQRMSNIAPTGLAHVVTRWNFNLFSNLSNPSFRDLSVGGMILPKDTMVFPLFAEILKVTINDWNSDITLSQWAMSLIKWEQGSHWENGDEFKPERFLDEDGKVLKDEHLIPFSIGRYLFHSDLDKGVFLPWSIFIIQQILQIPRMGHCQFERAGIYNLNIHQQCQHLNEHWTA